MDAQIGSPPSTSARYDIDGRMGRWRTMPIPMWMERWTDGGIAWIEGWMVGFVDGGVDG